MAVGTIGHHLVGTEHVEGDVHGIFLVDGHDFLNEKVIAYGIFLTSLSFGVANLQFHKLVLEGFEQVGARNVGIVFGSRGVLARVNLYERFDAVGAVHLLAEADTLQDQTKGQHTLTFSGYVSGFITFLLRLYERNVLPIYVKFDIRRNIGLVADDQINFLLLHRFSVCIVDVGLYIKDA